MLISPWDDAIFVWRKFIDDSGQRGVNCAIFRNESPSLASDMIREAVRLAWAKWSGERLYTYVDPRSVRGSNPGFCFLKAGWRRTGVVTKKGLIVLEVTNAYGNPVEGALVPSLVAAAAKPLLVFNEDCIAGMRKRLADDSVDLTVTSIPFEELFTYSGKLEDVGNNGSTIDIRRGRFALNMQFVIAELFRVHRPGTNVCIHIQQLLAYKNQHGFAGRRDFRGAVIDLFRAGGFQYHGEVAQPSYQSLITAADLERVLKHLREDPAAITAYLQSLLGCFQPTEYVIPKDPQAMAQRLNLHSLQFKTGRERSSTYWAMAPNDYVLVFQKPGEPANRVQCLYDAEKNPGGWVTQNEWIKWARGIWDDIDEFDVIDGARAQAQKAKLKELPEEKHVCPLQLEVLRRLIKLYSNPASIQPDVTVLDPFGGVGSTPAICVELDRGFVAFELKESYHANMLKNIERAREKKTARPDDQMTLMDLLVPTAAEVAA